VRQMDHGRLMVVILPKEVGQMRMRCAAEKRQMHELSDRAEDREQMAKVDKAR